MNDKMDWLIGIVAVLGFAICYGLEQIKDRLGRMIQILIDIRDGRRY